MPKGGVSRLTIQNHALLWVGLLGRQGNKHGQVACFINLNWTTARVTGVA